MSRIYAGFYRVFVMWEEDDGSRGWGSTDEMTYEDCQRYCMMFGIGVPYEGHRVIKAIII